MSWPPEAPLIDGWRFTNLSMVKAATTVFITPSFTSEGCVVACSGKLAAVGNYKCRDVSLMSVPGGSSKPERLVLVGDNSCPDPGGAVRFFGLPEMVASPNNGSGVTYLNTLAWPIAKALGVAGDANLKPSLSPTIGFTAFPPY